MQLHKINLYILLYVLVLSTTQIETQKSNLDPDPLLSLTVCLRLKMN